MKIGIISINLYPRALNFACPIHSFAFQRFLEKNGVESTIIDYMASYDYSFDFCHPQNYYEEEYNKLNKKAKKTKADEKKLSNYKKYYEEYTAISCERERRYKKFKAFTDKYYKKTSETYNSDLLETVELDFDCYICATDVIWKTCSIKKWGLERAFFLASHAMDNKYKIAYAGSRNSVLREDEEELFFYYLSDFDNISVREKSLQTLIETKGNMKAECVLDPVMLLARSEYESIAVLPSEEKYLLLYFVIKDAEDTIAQAISYARSKKLKIIEISDKASSSLEKMNIKDVEYIWKYDIGPEEWLGYFLNAECVFTNSFHACCFSILFEKELFVGSRNGDKVQNILEEFGIKERQFEPDRDLFSNPLPPINYDDIMMVLNRKRVESSNYILSAIQAARNGERPQCDYGEFRRKIKYEIIYRWNLPAEEDKGFELKGMTQNNGNDNLIDPRCECQGYKMTGWMVKVLIDNMWFWYLSDDTFISEESFREKNKKSIKLFEFGEKIPYFPFNKISQVIAIGVWDKIV